MRPTNEVWKDVQNFAGYYQVSNLGRVKSLGRFIQYTRNGKVFERWHNERILKPELCKSTGYLYVNLVVNKQVKHSTVHRLVAQAFILNPDNLPKVNHKDEDKTNNCADNLEWITNYDNLKYSDAWNKGVMHRRDYSGKNNPFYNKHHTDITKAKCSKATRGKIFVNDGIKEVAIEKSLLNEYLNKGYRKGYIRGKKSAT